MICGHRPGHGRERLGSSGPSAMLCADAARYFERGRTLARAGWDDQPEQRENGPVASLARPGGNGIVIIGAESRRQASRIYRSARQRSGWKQRWR